ncbi:hypothetical protein SDC9_129355 [bioreactor metagenome]|uniref:Uncharacterized protein n=1 Tax=bioreactor metagenome TaxID=1076179 RepID=A0A645CZ96_9ZZZZ
MVKLYAVTLVLAEIVTGSESTLGVRQLPEVTLATTTEPELRVSPLTCQ